jgi:HEPN domain-containing protein
LNSLSLAQSYLAKATTRLKILPILLEEDAFSDVVREAQELVELALKGMLRHVGVDPPKWHDVGGVLLEHASRFPASTQPQLAALAATSSWLRKEREFSFYGDIDFIPTEEYDRDIAERAIREAEHVVAVACAVIEGDEAAEEPDEGAPEPPAHGEP